MLKKNTIKWASNKGECYFKFLSYAQIKDNNFERLRIDIPSTFLNLDQCATVP